MHTLTTLLMGLCLASLTAQAETWINFNESTGLVQRVVQGDGLKLGLSGANNSNIKAGWIVATVAEAKAVVARATKVDVNASPIRVIPLTQSEQDALAAARATQRQVDEAARREAQVNEQFNRALILYLAERDGKTPRQVMDEIKAKMEDGS